MQRTLILHIGTHKTGTKTLQVFSALNRDALMAAGVHVLQAARVPFPDGTHSPGNHRLAWEIVNHTDTRTARDEALAELAKVTAPVAFVSSEDFEYIVHHGSGAFAEMRADFEALGYRVVAVVWLRRQDSYAESIYGQFVRGSVVRRFKEYLDEIVQTGAFDPFQSENLIAFDYELFVARIAAIFGHENVIARAWRPNPDQQALPSDLLRVMSRFVPGGLRLTDLRNPLPFANQRDTLRVLLDTARSTFSISNLLQPAEVVAQVGLSPAVLERRFAALSYHETIAMMTRFASSNERVKQLLECDLAFESLDHVAPPEHEHWSNASEQRRILDAAIDLWFAQTQ